MDALFIYNISYASKQNLSKFFIEIIALFSYCFWLSIIALTVRAVNFLDLIVDNGYPVSTYFKYSFLNLFGIAPNLFL